MKITISKEAFKRAAELYEGEDENGTEKVRRLLAAMGPENGSTLVTR